MGQGQADLKAAGLDINTIDAVIISHFHGDHINGLVTDGKPSFPNAEVMVPTPEWNFWMDDGSMAQAPEAMKGAFANVRRVFGIIGNKRTNYEPGKDVAPGIASMAAHGHSPGHTVHIVNSGNSSVMIQGDTTILPQLFVRNPGWHVMFDMDASGGRSNAPPHLRSARCRQDAGARLSLSVPGACLHREERHRLSRNSGFMESDDLIVLVC